MTSPLLYINTALGDDYLYFRFKGKVMVQFRNMPAMESSFKIRELYKYLKDGRFVHKNTATVRINGKRVKDLEERFTKLLTKE